MVRRLSAWLVNYAERHRAGLRVGTAITEGTANFLVNRRMNKSQQMRWSRRGADLLLQVRCAVYNGTLGSSFGQKFQPTIHVRLWRPPPNPQSCDSPWDRRSAGQCSLKQNLQRFTSRLGRDALQPYYNLAERATTPGSRPAMP